MDHDKLPPTPWNRASRDDWAEERLQWMAGVNDRVGPTIDVIAGALLLAGTAAWVAYYVARFMC